MRSFINFNGQICIVTGAGSADGIGFHTAKLLGELGGKVAVTATSDRIFERVSELEAIGVTAKGYAADLMDRSQVEEFVRQVKADFGRIDVLVNNAGMTQIGVEDKSDLFHEISYEDWDLAICRNLTLCFNVTRNVLPVMRALRYGRIVNISSVTGPLVSAEGESAYSAAKAAIEGMSRAIAIEVAKDNITINNVLPGWIKTASQSEYGAMGGDNTPIGRSAMPSEVANAAVFLCSKEASYITGQGIVVDGGNIIQEFKGQKL